MADQTSKTTTNHSEIQKWVEARGGKPAQVTGTEHRGDDAGVLRLMFPDAKQAEDDNLEEIAWDDWFRKFDQSKLALVYQEHTADGKQSSFNKLVSRDSA